MKHIRDPKVRIVKVHEHTKGKMVCDSSEPERDADGDAIIPNELRKIGCGHVQPVIRKEGLKLFMVYKKSKDDDEQVIDQWSLGSSNFYADRTLFASRTLELLSLIKDYSPPPRYIPRSRRSPTNIFIYWASHSTTLALNG